MAGLPACQVAESTDPGFTSVRRAGLPSMVTFVFLSTGTVTELPSRRFTDTPVAVTDCTTPSTLSAAERLCGLRDRRRAVAVALAVVCEGRAGGDQRGRSETGGTDRQPAELQAYIHASIITPRRYRSVLRT